MTPTPTKDTFCCPPPILAKKNVQFGGNNVITNNINAFKYSRLVTNPTPRRGQSIVINNPNAGKFGQNNLIPIQNRF